MDILAGAIIDFIAWNKDHPLPPNAPTRLFLLAVRAHLDATLPDWRERALERSDGSAIEVTIQMTSGRYVRGAILQRPSRVLGRSSLGG